jgi:hypothetical protein
MTTKNQCQSLKLITELQLFTHKKSKTLLKGVELTQDDIIDLEEITKELKELNPPKQTTTL